MILANIVGQEMLCTDAEALRIATAWVGLRRHYGGMGIDPKHQAILAFAVAIGSVELPKLRDRMARRRAEVDAAQVERAARDQAGGGTVVTLDPAGRGERPAPYAGAGWPQPHG